ncbi:unnamed protein product [Moneuplotes crassus]|uniref:Uncharacterized protein n=1 Tax=Euplotes crassus TaxID=5936 RepID=A0AAD2DC91_EUPCR|nr:unnamed protein product [Moneuplotes crassus]
MQKVAKLNPQVISLFDEQEQFKGNTVLNQSSSRTLGRKPSLILIDCNETESSIPSQIKEAAKSHTEEIKNYVLTPEHQLELDLELVEYIDEIEKKFALSKINRTYKFPRSTKQESKAGSRIAKINEKYMEQIQKFLKEDPKSKEVKLKAQSRLERQDRHQKFSEFRNPANVSIDEAQRIRNAVTKSHMNSKRNHNLESLRNSAEGSRNRSNLDKNIMWAKVSSPQVEHQVIGSIFNKKIHSKKINRSRMKVGSVISKGSKNNSIRNNQLKFEKRRQRDSLASPSSDIQVNFQNVRLNLKMKKKSRKHIFSEEKKRKRVGHSRSIFATGIKKNQSRHDSKKRGKMSLAKKSKAKHNSSLHIRGIYSTKDNNSTNASKYDSLRMSTHNSTKNMGTDLKNLKTFDKNFGFSPSSNTGSQNGNQQAKKNIEKFQYSVNTSFDRNKMKSQYQSFINPMSLKMPDGPKKIQNKQDVYSTFCNQWFSGQFYQPRIEKAEININQRIHSKEVNISHNPNYPIMHSKVSLDCANIPKIDRSNSRKAKQRIIVKKAGRVSYPDKALNVKAKSKKKKSRKLNSILNPKY